MNRPFIAPDMLERILPTQVVEWYETPEALALLAKIDAYERSSDAWSGRCDEAAKAFSEAADDAQCDLDNLRTDALHGIMGACPHPYASDAYFAEQDAAEETLPSVEDAIKLARRMGLGDGVLEQAA